jgi:hypothetical protein
LRDSLGARGCWQQQNEQRGEEPDAASSRASCHVNPPARRPAVAKPLDIPSVISNGTFVRSGSKIAWLAYLRPAGGARKSAPVVVLLLLL